MTIIKKIEIDKYRQLIAQKCKTFTEVRNKFPTKWEDLSPDQFIKVIYLISQFDDPDLNMSIRELQLRLYLELARINNRKLLKKDYSFFQEVIFKNMEKMSFVYKIIYRDDRFKNLSSKMQKVLMKVMPEGIDNPEAIFASRFERSIDLDLCFGKQLIPTLYNKYRKLPGYQFEIVSGVIRTSLTCEQYIDAISAMTSYAQGTSDALDLLVAILYTKEYSTSAAIDNLPKVKRYHDLVKLAVLMNFQAIINWISVTDKYKILFSAVEKSTSKNVLGMNDVVYNIVEKGYGNIKSVENTNLITFFDLMLKSVVDAAKAMKDAKMKRHEIAEKLNITLENLNTIL